MRVQEYEHAPAAVRRFSVVVPEFFNWGVDVVDRWAAEKGATPALLHVYEDGKMEMLTFRDVSVRSSQLASFLAQNGTVKGDRVMVMLPNTPDLWLSIVALIKRGAVIVPCATTLTGKDLEYRIAAAEIKGIITDRENLPKFGGLSKKYRNQLKILACTGPTDGEPAWVDLGRASSGGSGLEHPHTRSDDDALVYFTSGTEGLPKMVVHTQASYPLGHFGTALWLGLEEGKLHWNISSPGWAKHAWSSVFAPWNKGATTFSLGYKGGFRPADHLRALEKFKVNSVCAPPTIWRMFVLEDLSEYDLSSLTSVCSAGEPLNPEVVSRFKSVTGLTIRDGYGQTETVQVIGNFPGMEVKPGSMGIPSPLYDVDIVDEGGRILPAGTEGYVAISLSPRPFALFKGYANDPQKTEAVFKNGWYYTGDRASKDEDGYFWFASRADDVIKSSGYRIGPFEVESALIKHPAVAESGVVASPDPIRGAVVKAYVVLRRGFEPSQSLADELAEFVARETGPYKHPRKIEFVESLDSVKTISGKLKRRDLRMAEYGQKERAVSGVEFNAKPLRAG
jgi:acetyl-CoA synthetase/medium-chain acyl-CoA synthetase